MGHSNDFEKFQTEQFMLELYTDLIKPDGTIAGASSDLEQIVKETLALENELYHSPEGK